MQIIGFLLCFLVIIAAFSRLYDVFTKHMEKMADDELQKYMQANKVLHSDGGDSLAETELSNDEMDDTFDFI